MADEPEQFKHLGLVQLVLRAELGRCRMRLAEAAALAPGSIVTLDRLAGEPVEIRCREHVIARGEVVIQDDEFAIRVTDIVDRHDSALANSSRSGRPRRK
ncbi:MAG: FliM/FliN family flagellar motor switch protein [Armatimonadetes bacterium]|nr:FliM/FliN family flagellar motor switch protein [Armatimonadota bacterium]